MNLNAEISEVYRACVLVNLFTCTFWQEVPGWSGKAKKHKMRNTSDKFLLLHEDGLVTI